MSWVDKIKQQITIQLGGKTFTPNFISPQYEMEFNLSEYNFPNVNGTYIDRKNAQGKRHSLILFFQGEDHIELTNDLIKTNQQRSDPWKINHPYYGQIFAQPFRIKVDNRKYNISIITVAITETIRRDGLAYRTPPEVEIVAAKDALDQISLAQAELNMTAPDSETISTLSTSIEEIDSAAENSIIDLDDVNEFKNLVIDAQKAATNVISDVTSAVSQTQALINFPFQVVSTVRARVLTALDMTERLVLSAGNILGIKNTDKALYVSQIATIVSGASIASITNISDGSYGSAADVNDTIDIMSNVRTTAESFIESISIDGYSPDPDIIKGIDFCIDQAIASLIDIAFNSEQEFIILTGFSDNIIELSHRYYGPSEDDSNLERFITTNNIGLNEIFGLSEAREIKYYR
ncbi:MAG: hypothetical protein HRU26_07775 [Psychroserpens sp.]|nr:hypothetical protein [Psychroserpens sp.]